MNFMLLRMRLRRAAHRFSTHGWTVTPGSYFNGERMACDRPTCWASSCHPLLPDLSLDHDDQDWWRERPHSVLLPTGGIFDAIEVPALLGSAVRGTIGPVIILPSSRWVFLVTAGSGLRPELAHRTDIVLHAAGSWIPAPPTVLPEGQVRWYLSPSQVKWHLPEAPVAQESLLSAMVHLDASFLDLPLAVRRHSPVASRPSTMEAALRRAS
jgi:hypothetical protein